jgi:hypothetical protein
VRWKRKTMNQYQSDIVLGDRYLDKQTGIEGIASAVYFYQYGCERVNIEVLNKDGELKEYSFDAPRLTHVETGVRATTTKTGGPAKGSNPHRSAPSRR